MKTVGIIAEYNPFHNGHAYQIAEAKRITGADYAVVVMSGNFVQRGTPAVWDKYTRTRAALLCGTDLVFELPVIYATASAEFFAEGGVALLTALGVDYLCFGSECGDADVLTDIAKIFTNESTEFKTALDQSLRAGKSYPIAREDGYRAHCAAYNLPVREDILSCPNNLLGIEYCKAILTLNSPLIPYTVKRAGSGYHEVSLSPGEFCSATALRTLLGNSDDIKKDLSSEPYSVLKAQVPSSIFDFYKETIHQLPALQADDFSMLLSYRLLYENADSLSKYSDWTQELANRMISLSGSVSGFSAIANTLKSKQLTLTRTNRMLLHVLLQITPKQLLLARNAGSAFYARLLGLREASSKALRQLSDKSSVPVINKLAPALKELDGVAKELLTLDIRSSELYYMIQQAKTSLKLSNEFTRGVIRV